MGKYKIRFNLGRGSDRYMKWQIRSDGHVEHHEPSEVTLVMCGCKLICRENAAANIHRGANKTVCAWVECDAIEVYHTPSTLGTKDSLLAFNPKVNPFWELNGENVNNTEYDMLYTHQRRVYSPENKFAQVE